MLSALKRGLESHHGLGISDEAVSAAVQLSARYINDRFLPDKAIDLLDEAASRVRIEGGRDRVVGREEVAGRGPPPGRGCRWRPSPRTRGAGCCGWRARCTSAWWARTRPWGP